MFSQTAVYNHITFMNKDEQDFYEQMLAEKARPYVKMQVPILADWYLKGFQEKTRKHTSLNKVQFEDLLGFTTRIENHLRSDITMNNLDFKNKLIKSLAAQETDNPILEFAWSMIAKGVNQGLKEFWDIVDMSGITVPRSCAPTEAFAKKVLVENYGMADSLFIFLPPTGNTRFIYDPSTHTMRYYTGKSEFRSIDAIVELKHCVIVICMKYKGGTAAVNGSSQTDQSTEATHIAKYIEEQANVGNFLMHNDKPVFYANMVYGAQFQNEKGERRIYGNELALCERLRARANFCFNISLEPFTRVVHSINDEIGRGTNLTMVLKNVYNTHGLSISITGKHANELGKYL